MEAEDTNPLLSPKKAQPHFLLYGEVKKQLR